MFVYLFLSYDKYFTLTKNILDLREGRGCRKVTMDFTLKNLVRIFVKPDKIVRFLLRQKLIVRIFVKRATVAQKFSVFRSSCKFVRWNSQKKRRQRQLLTYGSERVKMSLATIQIITEKTNCCEAMYFSKQCLQRAACESLVQNRLVSDLL